MADQKVTIRDVAERANVSVATVSGVLNNQGVQSPSTVAKIKQVMQELNYIPRQNRRRQANNKQHQGTVALLVPDQDARAMCTPLVSGLAEGVQWALGGRDYDMQPMLLKPDGSLPDMIVDGRVVGVIVRQAWQTTPEQATINMHVLSRLPLVWMLGVSGPEAADSVTTDNEMCGLWAAQKVKDLQPDCVICYHPDTTFHLELHTRYETFRYVLSHSDVNVELVRGPGALSDLLKGTKSAMVFAPGHDSKVQELVQLTSTLATETDQDIRVLGVMSDGSYPSRSDDGRVEMLHLDSYRIGAAAAETLLWRIRHPGEPARRVLIRPREFNSQ